MTEEVFSVRIMSPKACVWESDRVTSLSAENSEGIFDILPDHARFMSLIESSSPFAIELADGTSKEYTFENALLSCDENAVVIYIQEDLEQV